MYNCVLLDENDCYVQCFLWRSLDKTRDPDTYQVVVNNIGVKPAGCIASLALYKTADRFKEQCPVTSLQLKENSYVDDLGLTGNTLEEIKLRVEEADKILDSGGFHVKNWVFSGDSEAVSIGDIRECLPLEDVGEERMLGVIWEPKEDVFRF